MAVTKLIAGKVYQHGTTTPIENVVVTIKIVRLNEEHNGAEDLFPELTTNSAGEFMGNLANFDSEYADDDVLEISLNYNGQKDLIFLTIIDESPVSNIVLTPMPNDDVYCTERGFDEGGSKISISTSTKTLESTYKSIDTETLIDHPIGGDVFASIQIGDDEEEHLEQGVVSHGVALGFFKIRYNLQKNNVVTFPIDTDNKWIVQDKPLRVYFGNAATHDEARLVRIA